MKKDLIATLQAIAAGQTTAEQEAVRCLEMAQSASCQHAFLTLSDSILDDAKNPTNAKSMLRGLPVSVKDLFDIQGQTTTAGSLVLAGAAPAQRDSVAVARLRQSGGSLLGRTNMVEFAFSGVGVNPHHGTPSAWDARIDKPARSPSTSQKLIPGGSSSGAAVSVATGASFIGLGSDTGGSIRIPAAFNGLVGFKSTARLVPTQGALPLSTTLDTACALTRSVRDAILAHEILSARQVPRGSRSLSEYRLLVCQNWMLEAMDDGTQKAFGRSLSRLSQAGARIVEKEIPELLELQSLMATGGFSAPESFAWHRSWLEHERERYDPRVAVRIERGGQMKAHEYLELTAGRARWVSRMERILMGFDAVLSPTTPIAGIPLEQVAPGTERDEEFFRVNALLLRNTSVVNTLDGCAISLPCHQQGEAPMGLMAWHAAMHDDDLLQLALLMEPVLQADRDLITIN